MKSNIVVANERVFIAHTYHNIGEREGGEGEGEGERERERERAIWGERERERQ